MKAIRDLLAEHELFVGLGDTAVDLLAGCGENVHFPPGKRILSEGQSADVFYVLRSGRVAVEIHVRGREPLVIET
ncbi:MAG: Crp/Fnr family transcriptional regulator, partial [Acidimicrobiales bacterium]